MTDMRQTIAPKSDQLNADDLIGVVKTIKVTKVSLCGEPDQPIAINYEGDNGKPYKPCKSMRRVMVNVWGSDGTAYAGRRMTLYRDDKVLFGGVAVGGIRISHMSDIDAPVTMALTASKANRKPFTVKPLGAAPASTPPPSEDKLRDEVDEAIMQAAKTTTLDGIERGEKFTRSLMQRCDKAGRAELKEMLVDAFVAARERVAPPPPDDGSEGY
jgi:hypothetical protein